MKCSEEIDQPLKCVWGNKKTKNESKSFVTKGWKMKGVCAIILIADESQVLVREVGEDRLLETLVLSGFKQRSLDCCFGVEWMAGLIAIGTQSAY